MVNAMAHVYVYSGEDLKKLFSSTTVQHFLNGTPMRELHSEKSLKFPPCSCCHQMIG